MVIKLSGVQFGLTHYFLTSIFKSPKYSTWSVEIFIYAVLSQSEIKFIHFFWGGGKVRVLETKIAKFGMVLFHFPAIRLVTLNKP